MNLNIIICLCTILFINTLSAQTENTVPSAQPTQAVEPVLSPDLVAPESEIKTFELFDIEKPPSFPDGEQELLRFLGTNIIYPDSAKYYGITGVVVATFVVNKDGSISDIKIIRDIGRDCGKEVIRVLSIMPAWIPGEANGKKVKVRYTLPVRFKLT